MHIKTVQMKNGKTTIEFEIHQDGRIREIKDSDDNRPHPLFQKAFEKLGSMAIDIIGLHIENLVVTKLHLKKDRDGNIGCVLTCYVEIQNCKTPWHFNTPVKFSHDGEVEAEHLFLTKKQVDHLRKLEDYAVKFINGERAQKDMFDKDKENKSGE